MNTKAEREWVHSSVHTAFKGEVFSRYLKALDTIDELKEWQSTHRHNIARWSNERGELKQENQSLKDENEKLIMVCKGKSRVIF